MGIGGRSLYFVRAAGVWLLRLGASALLLAAGFGLLLALVYGWVTTVGDVPAERAQILQLGLLAYFRLIFVKGLLPQLVLAVVLWPPLAYLRPTWDAAAGRRLLGLALAAGAAYAVVAPSLLTVDFAGWPALQMQRGADHVTTALLMTGAVSVAAWLPTLRRVHRL